MSPSLSAERTSAIHKQVRNSYDLNNDNYISEYELALFSQSHPGFALDKAFVAWVEKRLG